MRRVRWASHPYELFTNQVLNEAHQLQEACEHAASLDPKMLFLKDMDPYDLAEKNVKLCWQEQGIWEDGWTKDRPSGPWKQSQRSFDSAFLEELRSTDPRRLFGVPFESQPSPGQKQSLKMQHNKRNTSALNGSNLPSQVLGQMPKESNSFGDLSANNVEVRSLPLDPENSDRVPEPSSAIKKCPEPKGSNLSQLPGFRRSDERALSCDCIYCRMVAIQQQNPFNLGGIRGYGGKCEQEPVNGKGVNLEDMEVSGDDEKPAASRGGTFSIFGGQGSLSHRIEDTGSKRKREPNDRCFGDVAHYHLSKQPRLEER